MALTPFSGRKSLILGNRMGAFEQIMRVFVDAEGELRFPVADVEHILPWILLNMPVDMAALDDGTVAIFAAACERAGIGGDTSAESARALFQAYYDEQPPSPALVAALRQAWSAANAGSSETDPFSRFAVGKRQTTVVIGGGVRPEGTVPGTMGRFIHFPRKK